MKNGIRIKAMTGSAVKITCVFKGSVQDYAMAWLHLTNNARENPNVFLKHWNNSGNCVYVVTPEQWVEQVKDYLIGFNSIDFESEVIDVETVPTMTPVIDWGCDWNGFDYEEIDSIEVLPSVDAD